MCRATSYNYNHVMIDMDKFLELSWTFGRSSALKCEGSLVQMQNGT